MIFFDDSLIVTQKIEIPNQCHNAFLLKMDCPSVDEKDITRITTEKVEETEASNCVCVTYYVRGNEDTGDSHFSRIWSAELYTLVRLGAHLTIWDQTVGCDFCDEAWWGENATEDPTLFHAANCPSFGRRDVAELGLNVKYFEKKLGRVCGIAPDNDIQAWKKETRRYVEDSQHKGGALYGFAYKLLRFGGKSEPEICSFLNGVDLTSPDGQLHVIHEMFLALGSWKINAEKQRR